MSSTQDHSHTMDDFPIRVLDRWGNEIEVNPTEGQVSISLTDVANLDLAAVDELIHSLAHARAVAALWPAGNAESDADEPVAFEVEHLALRASAPADTPLEVVGVCREPEHDEVVVRAKLPRDEATAFGWRLNLSRSQGANVGVSGR